MSDVPVLQAPRVPDQDDDARRHRFFFSPWHLVLFPVALIMLVPLLWMLFTSLQTLPETRHFPPTILPASPQWKNYTDVLSQAPFGRWFANTVIVTVASVLGNLLFCSLAGYAFARIIGITVTSVMAAYAFAQLKFPGKSLLFVLVLATLMIPFQVVIIPTFLIVRHLHLIDTLGALIVPNLAGAFGIFMLRQFFRTLPIELEEAARIDGASRLGVLFKIVLPLSGPALATATFQGAHQSTTNLLMAANVMSVLPVLLLFFFAQRYFVRGIATTGLKG